AMRLYEMFLGPFEIMKPWSLTGVEGVYRFLQRVWLLYDKLFSIGSNLSLEDLRLMHKTIKKVTEDIENIKFNTAVAALMEWLNYLSKKEKISKEEYKTFLLLLAPFAPHISEELWVVIGEKFSIHQQSWPKFDNKYLQEEEATIVIQINGRVRETRVISKEIESNRAVVEKMVLQSDRIKNLLAGQSVKKTVYIPGKIINFVV
ncbi:class I tRNA ligase family protein, partial [Candidatus Daviesbacteria bacterium]|nr:class I tRNA ligase family protein [Candidatus Daviesbacteria bacterium]